MTEIDLNVGGHQYRLACEEGQESVLRTLAVEVDGRITAMRTTGGAMGEVRQLLFAALTMADELADLRAQLAGWEALAPAFTGVENVNQAIANLADRLEKFADDLENPANNA